MYDIFDTADDEQLFVAVVSDGQWKLFCDAFGLGEFANDPSLAGNGDRVRQRDRILPVIREALGAMTQAELMQKLDRTGLPFAAIASPEDLFDDPHLNAGGLVEVTLANGDKVKLPSLPVAFGDQRLHLRRDLPEPDMDAECALGDWN